MCGTASFNGKIPGGEITKIMEFIVGAFVGVIGDYVIYSMVDALAKATPGWATYGWGLFLAYNGAIAFWLGHALLSR